MTRTVYVHGAAALSAFGAAWRGLGTAVMAARIAPAPARQLQASHGAVPAFEVGDIPAAVDVEAKARKLMSHAARLGTAATGLALIDAGWDDGREDIAMYMGVGASGGAMDELSAMLDASIASHAFSLARFGTDGLAACNPLFTFQLMNNFTLCHGAILHGLGGPNGALYSRGTGTVAALDEAVYQVASGACERALAGGADSALHPVTWAQLWREGRSVGVVPGEGAALLALSAAPDAALAIVDTCALLPAAQVQPDLTGAARRMLDGAAVRDDDLVLLAYCDGRTGALLREAVATAHVVDTSAALGESLAAAPALAWAAGLDLIAGGATRRVLVLSAGLDGGLGLAVLRSAA